MFIAPARAENLRETPVVKAVQKVGPAVVNISIDYEVSVRPSLFGGFGDPFFDQFFQDFFDPRFDSKRTYTSLGSGVIIDGKQGLILTNAHVIETKGEIKATLQDGREFTAQIVGSDPDFDLAVLKIESKEELPHVPMGASSDIMVGETIIAIGNPFGFSNTVTTGVVSALDRSIRVENNKAFTSLIQTDASINPGNSGGPLLNIYGELIGINTAIYARAQGIGFAIPIDLAKKITNDLVTYGKVTQSWLGVIVQPMDQALADYMDMAGQKTLLVRVVEPDSPASRAGIKNGDIILEINGKPMSTVEEYRAFEKHIRAGEAVTLTLFRNRSTQTLTLKAVMFPDKIAPDLAKRLLGFDVQNAPKNTGVSVSSVVPDSYLGKQGLKTGDIILGLNNTTTPTTEIFYETVIRLRQDEAATVTVARGNRRYTIQVPLGN